MFHQGSMKRVGLLLAILIIFFSLTSLIVRHDVADWHYIALAKKYPQICHLADGEATLIKENWFLTAAHVATLLQEELENGEIPQVSIDNRKFDVSQVVLHPDFQFGQKVHCE